MGVDVLGHGQLSRRRHLAWIAAIGRPVVLENAIHDPVGVAASPFPGWILCSRKYVHFDRPRCNADSRPGPWWLVRNGKYDEAKRTLKRLTRKVELIKYTNEKEEAELANATYIDCFSGVNRRRTEIACVVFAIQPLTGQGITGYATT